MFAKNRNDFAHVLRGLEFENALPLERQSSVRTRQGVGRRVGQSKPCSAPLDRNCPSISGVRFDGRVNHDAGRFGCVSKHRQDTFRTERNQQTTGRWRLKWRRTADKNTGSRASQATKGLRKSDGKATRAASADPMRTRQRVRTRQSIKRQAGRLTQALRQHATRPENSQGPIAGHRDRTR